MAFSQLPAYRITNALNVDPLNQAITAYGQTTRQNALDTYKAQQDAIQNERQNALLGIQRNQETRAQKTFDDQRVDRFFKHTAGLAQMVDAEADPAKRQQMWGRMIGTLKAQGKDPAQFGIDVNDYVNGPKEIVAHFVGYRDPLETQKAQAELANKEAQTRYYDAQARAKAAGFTTKAVGGKLVAVAPDGSTQVIYDGDVSGDPTKTANIAAGLENMRKIPDQFSPGTFESAVGPLQGGDTYFFSPLARVWGSIANVGGNRPTTEVRNMIAGSTEALAASLKPFIRKPGEGTWTDADQARLVAIVGNLATARDKAEYLRALEGVRQRIMANFGIELPPLEPEQPPPKDGQPSGDDLSGVSDDDLLKSLGLR